MKTQEKNEKISQLGYRAIPHGIKVDEKEREKLGLSNNGKPWSEEDDKTIAVLFARGATCTQVALALKRTTVAIQTRASALHARAKNAKTAELYRNKRTGTGDQKIPAVKVNKFALSIRDAIADKLAEKERAAKKTAKKTVKH